MTINAKSIKDHRDNEFTCYVCKKTFPTSNNEEWNAEKAHEEFMNKYPECKDDEVEVVCHDCNKEFLCWFNALTDEQKKEMREMKGDEQC